MKRSNLRFTRLATGSLFSGIAILAAGILFAADPPPAAQPDAPAAPANPAPATGNANGDNAQGRQGRGNRGGGGNFQGGNFQGGRANFNGGGGGNFGGGNFGPGGAGNIFNLDDKQMELLREAQQADADELRKLDEKLRAAQKELVQAVIAEKYDETVVRQKADVVAKIQTDMVMLRAKAMSTLSPTLKPEQRESLENSGTGIALLMRGGGMGGRATFGNQGGERAGGGFNGRGPNGGGGNNNFGNDAQGGGRNFRRGADGGNGDQPRRRPGGNP